MKISQALLWAQNIFRQKNIDSANIDAVLLLMHTMALSKEQVIFNPEQILTAKQYQDFCSVVGRRQSCEPISHILGKREFYGADFAVCGDVLDPRPDSESLIELVLQRHDQRKKLNILELGVGSGCLIITLLKNYKNAQATAVDLSAKALKIAQINSKNHQVVDRLKLLESDLFLQLENEKFDLIISNPPYIKSQEINNLSDEVKLYEPLIALDGGEDGLGFYRQIADKCGQFLVEAGEVIVEIGYGQKDDIVKIFKQKNRHLKALRRDLAGIDRILVF